MEPSDFCRDIERYLCQKNDGHLIRVVGPSFEIVSRWAADGIPLKVAFQGIDRYFERYYAKGPRRRPVRIDFCEADVLDVFDEWRRAIGLTQASVVSRRTSVDSLQAPVQIRQSLPAYLGRVVTRLTSARASGKITADFDDVIDRAARELDAARQESRGVRGAAREALVERLDALDREVMQIARRHLDEHTYAVLAHEADEELAGFRATMPDEAFERAREAAVERLVRERFGLPVIAFHP